MVDIYYNNILSKSLSLWPTYINILHIPVLTFLYLFILIHQAQFSYIFQPNLLCILLNISYLIYVKQIVLFDKSIVYSILITFLFYYLMHEAQFNCIFQPYRYHLFLKYIYSDDASDDDDVLYHVLYKLYSEKDSSLSLSVHFSQCERIYIIIP